MNAGIHHSETIFNSLKKFNLTQKLSHIAVKHIITIIITIFTFGYRGKTVNFERNSDNHRTTAAYFLNKGKWDSDWLETVLKQTVINIIYSESEKSGKTVMILKRSSTYSLNAFLHFDDEFKICSFIVFIYFFLHLLRQFFFSSVTYFLKKILKKYRK